MKAQEQQDKAFKLITMILEPRVGEEMAITIDSMAAGAGLSDPTERNGEIVLRPKRRIVEHILETRFNDFPFLVISSSKGYFRPQTEEEMDHWWASCSSRIRAIALRMKTGRIKARSGGFQYAGNGRFQRVKQAKNDLFE